MTKQQTTETKKKKVKILVHDTKLYTERAEFLRDIINQTDEYEVVNNKTFNGKMNSTVDIHYFVDFPAIKVEEFVKKVNRIIKAGSAVVYDISYTNAEAMQKEVLYTICFTSNGLTTDNAMIQQELYENTGYFASVLSKMYSPEDLVDPTTRDHSGDYVGWVGTAEVSFSMIKHIKSNLNTQFILRTTETGKRAFSNKSIFTNVKDIFTGTTTKVQDRFLNSTKFIFLPQSFSNQTEFNRLYTTIYYTVQGKLVITEPFTFSGEGLLEEEQNILSKYTTIEEGLALTEEEIVKEIQDRQEYLLKTVVEVNKPDVFIANTFDSALQDYQEVVEETQEMRSS